MLPAKARSVAVDGADDDWSSPRGWRAQASPDGQTRLVIYAPPDELQALHLGLIGALSGTISVRYVRLTDRATGPLPKPASFVGMDLAADRVREAMRERPGLIWHDGRHQLWLRGAFGDQVVIDELGVLYAYPDDPAFRDVLGALPEISAEGIDARDYVRVEFLATADAEEASFIEGLGLREWE